MKEIAVFIDCENVGVKYIDKIISDIKDFGDIKEINVYKNWCNDNSWNNKILEYNMTPIHNIPICTGKNSLDIKIVVDIMDLISVKAVDYIVIVGSDSDYLPLVRKLISKNINVIGFGENKTSKYLQNACFKFFNLSLKPIASKKIELSLKLESFYKSLSKNNEPVLFCKFGNKYNDFDLKAYGFTKWKSAFEIFPNKFKIYKTNNNETFVKLLIN